jgi:hypothetical protein
LGRTTVQNEATMLRTAGGKARGGGAPKAREDDAAAVEPQEAGVGRGGSRPRSGADSGRPTSWRGARASTDFRRPPAAENPVGQRTVGAAEGGGRGG